MIEEFIDDVVNNTIVADDLNATRRKNRGCTFRVGGCTFRGCGCSSIFLLLLFAVIFGVMFYITTDEGSKNVEDFINSKLGSSFEDSVVEEGYYEVSFIVDGQTRLYWDDFEVDKKCSLLEDMYIYFYDDPKIVTRDGNVVSFKGEAEDPAANRYWTYTINGESTNVPLGEYYPKVGDKIVFNLQVVED